MLAFGSVASAESTRSMALRESDPSGIVLTLTAVTVVFSALILLVIVFKGIARLLAMLSERAERQKVRLKGQTTTTPRARSLAGNEEAIAISLALQSRAQDLEKEAVVALSLALAMHQKGDVHDNESYRQTIRHRPSLWHSKYQAMRPSPN